MLRGHVRLQFTRSRNHLTNLARPWQLIARRFYARNASDSPSQHESTSQTDLSHWKSASTGKSPLEPLKAAGPRTMLHYIHGVQERFPHAVVLAQVGSFMEMYFDQAVEFGPRLNLKVARKSQRHPVTGQDSVNMAGFPLPELERYEKILVQDLGKIVVTLMQNSKEVMTGGSEEDKRPIARILSPGTLLAESFVDGAVNNYLVSVHAVNKDVAVVWADVATGRVQYETAAVVDLGNILARIEPREVLVDRGAAQIRFLLDTAQTYAPHAALSSHKFPTPDWWATRANDRERFAIDELPVVARKAFLGLASYIEESLPGTHVDLQPPEPLRNGEVMQLDARAREALELSSVGGRRGATSGSGVAVKGSLLSVIRRTRTPSGSRLLQDWLAAPLLNLEKIDERQNRVQFLLNQPRSTLTVLQDMLSKLPDGPRTIQKLQLGRTDPLDLYALASSVMVLRDIHLLVSKLDDVPVEWSHGLAQLLDGPTRDAQAILSAINVDAIIAKAENEAESEDARTVDSSETTTATNSAPITADGITTETPKATGSGKRSTTKVAKTRGRKGPAVRASSSGPLNAVTMSRSYRPVLHASVTQSLQQIYDRQAGFNAREDAILKRVKTEFGPSAEPRWSPAHNFYIHVSLRDMKYLEGAQLDSARLLARNKSAAYIYDEKWAELGSERIRMSEDLRIEEQHVIEQLRQTMISNHTSSLRKAYAISDAIDVYQSFAVLAREKGLTRPELVEDSGVYEIEKGRHITVETGMVLGGYSTGGFVANDCSLSAPSPMCMITGPNMGGKSTYIRQSAIIALLAHMGSYVPAKRARIGLVDRIFCRIGAGDDLYHGRSTFMMEMLETATILNKATDRSLAVLDEVGRGTSGRDGVAIAFATIKHLALAKQCRTLFATHYGEELWRLLSADTAAAPLLEAIRMLQASVDVADDGSLLFNYELQPGISASSHGLLIARLAGFPDAALRDAETVAAY